MNYQVLARKYRPRSFEDFVGQEYIVKTLTASLEQKRLHHAYLFTGTRGVGKTTLGRILAKGLNCKEGITASPCKKCESCRGIEQGTSMDLIEIDAASHTKVESIREWLSNVQYAPMRDRFKIYLIDEVHMLSNHSFNALLKTLEEPPDHVKFILATTEVEKLPLTILSRCLQFHLKNLIPSLIMQQLIFVCESEKVEFDTEALRLIAEMAGGSLRDGLSLLDQVISYTKDKLTVETVRLLLGNLESSELIELLKALIEKNGILLIQHLRQLIEKGKDSEQILESFLSLLHEITVLQLAPEASISSRFDKNTLQCYTQQIKKEQVQLFYQIALIGRRDLAWAPTLASGLEMVFLRMLAFLPDSSLEKNSPLVAQNKNLIEEDKHVPKPPLTALQPWNELVKVLPLTGVTRALAEHCELEKLDHHTFFLRIAPEQNALANDKQLKRLEEILSIYFGETLKVKINLGTVAYTPALEKIEFKEQEKKHINEKLKQDPYFQLLRETFST